MFIRYILPIITILLFTLAVFWPASSEGASEVRLDTEFSTKIDLDIFGDYVVWSDNRNGNWDIYMYNLNSESEIPLTFNSQNQDQPKVFGNYVIWRDARNGNYDIYMYDIITGQEMQITYDYSNQTSPSIYASWIVWEDDRNGNSDIYIYEIDTRREVQLTFDTANQKSPTISEMTIAYLDDSDSDYEIYMGFLPPIHHIDSPIGDPGGGLDVPNYIDLSITDLQQITFDSVDQDPPSISDFKIAWSDARDSNKNVYVYDMISGQETRLTSNPMDQYNPRIYGNTVLWVDERNINQDIYHYDMLTRTQKKLTTSSSDESSCAIFYNKIVWVSDRSRSSDLYLLVDDLPYYDPPDGLPQGKRPGSAEEQASILSRNHIIIAVVFIIVILVIVRLRAGRQKPEEEQNIPTLRDLNKLKKKDELVKMCAELGLVTTGNKKRLRKRLVSFVKTKEREKKDDEQARRKQVQKQLERAREGKPTGDALAGDQRRIGRNQDFEDSQLVWDDGLISTGIVGEKELMELENQDFWAGFR